jgi:hypothetical protein
MNIVTAATPLCPAGHLPLKGGDPMQHSLASIFDTAVLSTRPFLGHRARSLRISSLEGEMSGRAEGGIPTLRHSNILRR